MSIILVVKSLTSYYLVQLGFGLLLPNEALMRVCLSKRGLSHIEFNFLVVVTFHLGWKCEIRLTNFVGNVSTTA